MEYIIIDGGSTDNSVEIIKKYQSDLAFWVSESDDGMYHAINKGLDRSTGDIMCWINSDDILWEGSLDFVAEKLNPDNNGVRWLQGYPTVIDEGGNILYQRYPVALRKDFYDRRFEKDHAFIQQESTFWTRSLWEEAEAKLNTAYKLAADFDLWMQFFHCEKLCCTQRKLGAFRIRKGQKSGDQEGYVKEALRSVKVHKKKRKLFQRLKLGNFRGSEEIHWID